MNLRLALVLILFGCSDDSEKDAPDRCERLARSLCEVNSACAVETGAITEDKEDQALGACVSGLSQAFNCPSVAKTTGDPDLCVEDLKATSCDQFNPSTGLPLPPSCHGVFER